jgi:hypothetical protein
MLTDTALRNLKPKAKPYKASDRDGIALARQALLCSFFNRNRRISGVRPIKIVRDTHREGSRYIRNLPRVFL